MADEESLLCHRFLIDIFRTRREIRGGILLLKSFRILWYYTGRYHVGTRSQHLIQRRIPCRQCDSAD